MSKDCRHALHSFVRSIISMMEPEEEDVGDWSLPLRFAFVYYDTVYNTWIRTAGMSNG